MPHIEIQQSTYEQLILISRVTNESVGRVVDRMLERLAAGVDHDVSDASDIGPIERPTASGAWAPHATAGDTDSVSPWIDIHKVYKGHRIEGTFNRETLEVVITSGALANRGFSSPTAAAVAVVLHFSGDVRESPNTNGRLFWKVTKTGKNLRSLIGER